MTSTGNSRTPAEVEAAVERWAAAAGVPASVARGYEEPTPAARRLLRGIGLGLLVGLPPASVAQFDGLAVLLVLAGLVLVMSIVHRCRASVVTALVARMPFG